MRYSFRIEHGDIETDEENRVLEVVARTIRGLVDHGMVEATRGVRTNDWTEWVFESGWQEEPLDTLRGLQDTVMILAPGDWKVSTTITNWSKI